MDNNTLEVILGLCFLALPIFGVMFAKLVHGPVMVRYFLSALIGFCIVVGTIFGKRRTAPWVSIILAITMTLIIGEQFGRLVWHRYKGWGENLIEPISGRPMNTSPGHPLERYQLLVSEASASHLPIGLLTEWDFIYLLHYAPQLLPRMYYINTSPNDFYARSFRALRPWSLVKYNPQLTFDEFCRQSPAFLLYGLYRDGEMNELSEMTKTGVAIKSLKTSDGHFLAEMETRVIAHLDDSTRARER